MENKQLEFKGKGWKAQRKAFDRDAALQGLYDIARSYIPAASVHVDATDNPELWHRSRVSWSTGQVGWDGTQYPKGPRSMEVYYHSGEVLLPVFAHECGHLETMAELGGLEYYTSSPENKYKCEYFASCWALGYLHFHKMPLAELRRVQARLQSCLDNYREGCSPRPARAVLDFKDSPFKYGQKAGV